MSRLVALLALGAVLGPLGVHAQVTAAAPEAEQPQYQQRWDIYGGAQYMHFNPGIGRGGQVAATNLLGWTGGATLWLKPLLGIEASGRGVYGTMTVPPNIYGIPKNPKMSEHLALAAAMRPDLRHYTDALRGVRATLRARAEDKGGTPHDSERMSGDG